MIVDSIMILILRGHIRTAFETLDLYNLIGAIYKEHKTLTIFIHTWNTLSNGVSWRNIKLDTTKVSPALIHNYFKELSVRIKCIFIEEENVPLIGNITGNVSTSTLPIQAWKKYWYGKHRIAKFVYETENINSVVINTRFDVLNNSNSIAQPKLLSFIHMIPTIKNIFISPTECTGIDNFYIGTVATMYKLADKFYYGLDEMLTTNTQSRTSCIQSK